jgi:hypothetical protein
MSTPSQPGEALTSSALTGLDYMLSKARLAAVELQPGEHAVATIHRGSDGAISVTLDRTGRQRETYRVGR